MKSASRIHRLACGARAVLEGDGSPSIACPVRLPPIRPMVPRAHHGREARQGPAPKKPPPHRFCLLMARRSQGLSLPGLRAIPDGPEDATDADAVEEPHTREGPRSMPRPIRSRSFAKDGARRHESAVRRAARLRVLRLAGGGLVRVHLGNARRFGACRRWTRGMAVWRPPTRAWAT